ncbi:hypothetical protein M407DRAFT_101316 [Tulasnella calospora MUT 4182]|uniref:Uncharacterized protein n=1 Tax=Tulasnella calospora MUT 4182 TaxID=1051891 RepID=A0A0C3QG79_9AGAM|nr:hypothetical protein M407DRAFT_101316 [Tulasnella calospora MUT 4182]
MLRLSTNGQESTNRHREHDQEAEAAIALETSQDTPVGSPRPVRRSRDVIFSAEGSSRIPSSTTSYPPQPSSRPAPIAMSRGSSTRTSEGINETPDFAYAGGFSPITGMHRRRRAASDAAADRTGISNLKLAENQQILSAQLEQLLQVVENLREEIRGVNGGSRA